MKYNYVSVEESISRIQSGQRIFLHGNACTPNYLIDELARQSRRLKDVEVVSISLQGDLEIAKEEYSESFFINSLFVSTPVRKAVNEGRGSFVPVFLSEIPILFRKKILPLDVTLIQVSPPDKHGYCSLGVSVDTAIAAVDSSKLVIAQVNPKVPRTYGDGLIHVSKIDELVWYEQNLISLDYGEKVGEAEEKIGVYIAELIEDRSTLQMGIGAVPDAVLKNLINHKDLGIHTEMCSNGVVDLILEDVINNKYKPINPHKTVTSFCMGNQRLYDFVDENPSVCFLDIEYVNNPSVISKNYRMIAINSAIEVDITGQVCSDSIGSYQYSGIGGQMDFMRGAALSEGGKPIIALTSRTKKGLPRIVSYLNQGAGVVTTRGHVHYIVTEYGVAYLYGKNLNQRAKELIKIAHPDDRENLEKSFFERGKKKVMFN